MKYLLMLSLFLLSSVSVESLQEQSADKPIGEISPKVDIPLL